MYPADEEGIRLGIVSSSTTDRDAAFWTREADGGGLNAGLRFTPVTLVAALLSPIAGRRAGPGSARIFLGVGLGLIGVGLFLLTMVEAGDAWTVMLPGFWTPLTVMQR